MDDKDADRLARAERLKKQIRELTSASDDAAPPADSPQPLPGESEAEFVQRRMREIERKRGS